MKWIRRCLFVLLLASVAWGQPELRLKARASRIQARQRLPRPAPGTHYFVRFGHEPGAGDRRELEDRGLRVLQYVPDGGLLVAGKAVPELAGLDVLSVDAMAVEDKISPFLDETVGGALLVIFHADVDPAAGRRAVVEAGFEVVENPSVLPGQVVVQGRRTGIEALAALDEVAYILPASPELAAGVPMAGCIGAATQAGPVGEYVLVGQGWPKDTAGNVAIQYFIRSLTEKLDASVARAEIERALREWPKYANFTLTPGSQQGRGRAIDILFARGAHGDAYPFDGAGGALAHTFYPAPPNPEAVAGDMHLDAEEPWSIGGTVDLYSVALHEAGHALGLGHSDRPGSVMYPYYRLAAGLTSDDIAGIQALYGSTAATPPNPPPTPPTPPAPKPPPAPVPPQTGSGKDTVAPVLAIVSPGFTIAATTAPSITLSGSANDNVGVTAVKWTNSTGSSGVANGTSAWSAGVPLLVGTNVISVRAYDAAGNSAWRAVTVVRH